MSYDAYQLSGKSRNHRFCVLTCVVANFFMQGQPKVLEIDTRRLKVKKSLPAPSLYAFFLA